MKIAKGDLLRKDIYIIVCIFLLGIAGYSFMLSGSFFSLDDQQLFVRNADIRDFANTGEIFRQSIFGLKAYYRPLSIFLHAVQYHLFGLSPFFFKLTHVILHILVSISIFFFISYLFHDRGIGSITALLYVLHPLHWEAVITSHPDLLCGFFYINAFFLFCLSQQHPKGTLYYVFSFFCFICALFSKEFGVTLPVLLCSYVFFCRKQSRDSTIRCFLPIMPFFTFLIIYLVWRNHLGITFHFRWESLSGFMVGCGIFLKSIVTYCRLVIVPTGLHLSRLAAVPKNIFSIDNYLLVTFFLIGAAILFYYRRRLDKKVYFFLSWIFITLSPVSQLVPIYVQPGYLSMAEHFTYIPSVGMFVLLILIVRYLYRKATQLNMVSYRSFVFVVIGWFVFLLLTTMQQSIYASNEIALYEQALSYNPDNTRVRYALGRGYVALGKYAEAEREFKSIIEIDPTDERAHVALGVALFLQGRHEDGIAVYEKYFSISDRQENAMLKNNLAIAYGVLIKRYQAILQKDPKNRDVGNRLEELYSKM